ncbi:hypothetical protein BU26DRAFT_581966 [Trematosphaeria pertusa]|uniref:Uncharacterized protein n=1 Tax=Trematosphaeria pertusa TaxID=390896 RepID=A0A6A6I089_9PLEO|nr:uncharacterized protein BU26DRAFT_581966 [Trematosphaeria pertusa]KAF2242980.1 hypothetical protein BU26DRAFT_581966 [Trematosphaeria pertusa]
MFGITIVIVLLSICCFLLYRLQPGRQNVLALAASLPQALNRYINNTPADPQSATKTIRFRSNVDSVIASNPNVIIDSHGGAWSPQRHSELLNAPRASTITKPPPTFSFSTSSGSQRPLAGFSFNAFPEQHAPPPAFSFNAHTTPQQGLPNFSFCSLPKPVEGLSPAPEPNPEPMPPKPPTPPVGIQSAWSTGFEMRNGNARRAHGRTAPSPSPYPQPVMAHNVRSNQSAAMTRRAERNQGPAKRMRKAVARLGYRLAELDDSDPEFEMIPTPQTAFEMNPTSSPLASGPYDEYSRPTAPVQENKTEDKAGSMRKRWSHMGEMFGLNKEVWAKPPENLPMADASLLRKSPRVLANGGVERGEQRRSKNSWKGSWSLGGRKRERERGTLFDINWERKDPMDGGDLKGEENKKRVRVD